MLDLGGADADGQRPEGAVGSGVAVTADDGHAGLGEALLGADDVDDALADIVHGEKLDAEVAAVLFQGLDLEPRFGVRDAGGAVAGGHVVVGHRECRPGPPHRSSGEPQPGEGLGAGDLVDQVPVDIDQGGAIVLLVDQVAVPDLVVEGAGL